MRSIHYTLCPSDPKAHQFTASITVKKPNPEGQMFSLPNWLLGSYLIRDFSKNLGPITAHCQGEAVELEQIDLNRWQAKPCTGALTLEYTIYAWDLSVRTAHLDETHGFFNGTSVFLKAEGLENKPCSVELIAPQGEEYADWRIATSLKETDERYAFGGYEAKNYDELIDHPVEMGTFTLATFEACGVPHDIAITGRHHADMNRLCQDLKTICEYEINFFGQPAPMERYVFLVMTVGNGYGGLEHRASTALLCNRSDLPTHTMTDLTDGYLTFLELCSHEYFHTWNVKRIRPKVYAESELHTPALSKQLWAFEGITSYYDALILVRCGLIKPQRYLKLLSEHITRVQRNPGRFKQTVAESSFNTWTKFYQQDENVLNAIVSYYTKGALVALGLDALLRHETHGLSSLDDLMLLLWNQYGKKDIPLDEGEIEALAVEMGGSAIRTFFDQAIYGTQDIDLTQLLSYLGVTKSDRPRQNIADKGGCLDQANTPAYDLGMISKAHPMGVQVTHIVNGKGAHLAGLSSQDVIIAVDGLQVSDANLEAALTPFNVGETVKVHAFRRDELMEFELTLTAAEQDTCCLELTDESLWSDWLNQ